MFQKFVLLKFRTADKKHLPCKKKKQLSLKQRREFGLYKINRTGMKYKDFQELHCLWKEYMRNCLDLEELKKRGYKTFIVYKMLHIYSLILSYK
jgi:hypothetical protein